MKNLQLSKYWNTVIGSVMSWLGKLLCWMILLTRLLYSGYIVSSGTREQAGIIGLRFIVQSTKDTVSLENRIEAFLLKLQVSKIYMARFTSASD